MVTTPAPRLKCLSHLNPGSNVLLATGGKELVVKSFRSRNLSGCNLLKHAGQNTHPTLMLQTKDHEVNPMAPALGCEVEQPRPTATALSSTLMSRDGQRPKKHSNSLPCNCHSPLQHRVNSSASGYPNTDSFNSEEYSSGINLSLLPSSCASSNFSVDNGHTSTAPHNLMHLWFALLLRMIFHVDIHLMSDSWLTLLKLALRLLPRHSIFASNDADMGGDIEIDEVAPSEDERIAEAVLRGGDLNEALQSQVTRTALSAGAAGLHPFDLKTQSR
ncbi:hypothetical protein JVT61DRAFT_15602 [Boletus reticuloceps]|uniref:Uncharacterized protein n=1 Tax=Boletus reticuloceps TaxID=495285 RepID=A0A8I2YC86_9AGAM|nr:hypothetical protein JVT61DRAFT_1510 [Boletus reticuloceps]KAG6369237.1 hypothetical protein JVT61DRAFT_15602 [Boletus reticuloceps]